MFRLGVIVCGVHLSAKSAALLAGVLMEPSASLANASGLYPAATPTAEPVDEPPGFFICQRILRDRHIS